MPVVNAWCGAITDRSARVIAHIDGSTARLGVSDRPNLAEPVWSPPVVTDEYGLVDLSASDLTPHTRYYWMVDVDGQFDTVTTGAFTTHPTVGAPATFTIAAASCAGLEPETPGVGDVAAPERLSNHRVFASIADMDPLMFVHTGDLHYYDLGTGDHGIPTWDEATYLRAYNDVLAQPRQHQLYRTVPVLPIWDDHDFGPNNSDTTSPGRQAAQAAYRRRVPSYRLDDSAAIYQSWQIGRVLCVALDVRSYRSPNSMRDGPSKTMLGGTQKAWLRRLLARSDAAALVVFSPSMWYHPTGRDTWASFTHEQAELIELFRSTGWVSRMVMVCGDTHSAAIDTGSGSPGGIPVLQAAALDARPGPAWGHFDVGPAENERGQYGLVAVTDAGGPSLRIRLSTWRAGRQLAAHSLTVATDTDDEPPPSVDLPAPTEARPHATMTWLACEAIGGKIIAELPEVDGQLSRILGAHTSTSLNLAAPLHGRAKLSERLAERATSPGRTLIAAVLHDAPAWTGLVVSRSGGTDAKVQLSTVTPEGYLDRRRVGDHVFRRTDQAMIAARLLGDAEAKTLGDRKIGAGLGLLIDAPPSDIYRDRSYAAGDRKTIYAVLTELMGVENGPEWTIDPVWSDSTQTGVSLVARVANRIGKDRPDVAFTPAKATPFAPGQSGDLTYTHAQDYSDGQGGNWVIAYSSGEGDDQPASDPAVAEDVLVAGWPIFERVWQPSSSISDPDTLNAHATAELARIAHGAVTWKLTTRFDVWPRLGIDWNLGDTLSWHAVGHLHPHSITATGRVIGWNLNPKAGTVKPVLLEPGSNTTGGI